MPLRDMNRPSSDPSGSPSRPPARRAPPAFVLYALAANVLVAASKYAAAWFTGSSAMLAEAFHSSADCINQLLLLLGHREASASPDEDHPFGFGRGMLFYAVLVGFLVLSLGGGGSVVEGVHQLLADRSIDHPLPAFIVLAVSAVFEGLSFRKSLAEVGPGRGWRSLWRWFKETRRPALLVTLTEDAAALVGLSIAAIALGLTVWTGHAAFDAGGSIVIGVMLVALALLMIRELKSQVVGEAADRRLRLAMRQWLDGQPQVRSVISLVVLQWDEAVLVAMQVEFTQWPGGSGIDLIEGINRLERDLRQRFPMARWIFVEPELADPRTQRL